MKDSLEILESAEKFLAGKGISAEITTTYVDGCERDEIETNLDDARELVKVVEDYNATAGCKELQLCLLTRRSGKNSWSVDEEDVWHPLDATKQPEVYGSEDCNDTYVIAYNDLDDEEGFDRERAEDLEGDTKNDYLRFVEMRYTAIRAEMTAADVVVCNNTWLDFEIWSKSKDGWTGNWSVCSRYPVAYNLGSSDYRYAIFVNKDFIED